MSRPTAQIDYAPRPPPPAHRARWFRRVATLALAVVAAGACVRWGPAAWRRIQVLHLQRQCMTRHEPYDLVVLEVDAERARALAAGQPAYRSVTQAGSWQPYAYYLPPEWESFYAAHSPSGLLSFGTVFLHERRTPSGRRRLVTVDFSSREFVHGYNWPVQWRVFEPGSLLRPPRLLASRQTDLHPAVGPNRLLRAYAGQVDWSDPAHFTVEVEHARGTTLFDGWLRDDDTVLIEPREGHAVPQAAGP